MNMKEKISRLMYLRKQLEMLIDNAITEELLRGRDIDPDRLQESLLYHIDDQLGAYKQNR